VRGENDGSDLNAGNCSSVQLVKEGTESCLRQFSISAKNTGPVGFSFEHRLTLLWKGWTAESVDLEKKHGLVSARSPFWVRLTTRKRRRNVCEGINSWGGEWVGWSRKKSIYVLKVSS